MTTNNNIWNEFCAVCGEPFSREEWDHRHSTNDGSDCHEACCPICNSGTFEDDDYELECTEEDIAAGEEYARQQAKERVE